MSEARTRIVVEEHDFDPGALIASAHEASLGVGAVAAFVGLVRDTGAGERVRAMTLEHYPEMTARALGSIVEDARGRWRLGDVTVVHRHGRLAPGDRIVCVVVASAHRGDAFAACEFIMDYLKTRAPFWKKEDTASGARWVEARASDDQAMARWAATREE